MFIIYNTIHLLVELNIGGQSDVNRVNFFSPYANPTISVIPKSLAKPSRGTPQICVLITCPLFLVQSVDATFWGRPSLHLPRKRLHGLHWFAPRWSNLIIVILVLKLYRDYRTCSPHQYSSRWNCNDNNACLPQDILCQGSDWGTKTDYNQDIVQNLKHDLLSGKMLNKARYRIIFDEDPEESGIFVVVNEGKICKSKSFPFMEA